MEESAFRQQCKGNKIKHEWQCKDGHTWWAKPNGIQQGSWCPECGWGGKPDINEAHTIAKELEDNVSRLLIQMPKLLSTGNAPSAMNGKRA